jgi:hypothetical protein
VSEQHVEAQIDWPSSAEQKIIEHGAATFIEAHDFAIEDEAGRKPIKHASAMVRVRQYDSASIREGWHDRGASRTSPLD